MFISCSRYVADICNKGMCDLPDKYAQNLRPHISGKSQVPMLQLRYNTLHYGKLKVAQAIKYII